MTIDRMLSEGDFDGAVAAIRRQLDERPDDPNLHFLHFQMNVLDEAFADAERDLGEVLRIDPGAAEAVEFFGGLIAAERARGEFLGGGRGSPGFVSRPPVSLKEVHDAVGHVAAGRLAEAEAALASHAAKSPRRGGVYGDGTPFVGIRDADDLLAPVLEALTPGAYLWLPFAQIEEIEMQPGQGLADVIWMPARVRVAGTDCMVRIPSIYAGTAARSGHEKLGLLTQWEHHGSLGRAYGQRDLRLGGEEGEMLVGIRQVERIRIDRSLDPA